MYTACVRGKRCGGWLGLIIKMINGNRFSRILVKGLLVQVDLCELTSLFQSHRRTFMTTDEVIKQEGEI